MANGKYVVGCDVVLLGVDSGKDATIVDTIMCALKSLGFIREFGIATRYSDKPDGFCERGEVRHMESERISDATNEVIERLGRKLDGWKPTLEEAK